jgi:hypothetical protein
VAADNFKLLRFDFWRFERKLVLDIQDFLTTDTDDVMMGFGIRIETFLIGVEV